MSGAANLLVAEITGPGIKKYHTRPGVIHDQFTTLHLKPFVLITCPIPGL